MTSAFQTLPAAEYGRLAVRWVGANLPQGLGGTVPYAVHAQYALKPISLLGIFVAGVEHGAYDAFCGVAAFSFAILGAILWWRERYVRWLATIGLCGIVFALGGNSVFHGMFYALAPLVEKSGAGGGYTVLFGVAVAVLRRWRRLGWMGCRKTNVDTTVDAARMEARATNTKATAKAAAWILAGCGAVVALGCLGFYAGHVASDPRLVVTALCALLAAGLIAMRASPVLVILLVLFELGNVTDYKLATADRATHPYLYKLAEHSDVARVVGGSRIVYDSTASPYNIGDWYGIEALNAYAASVPASLWQHAVFSERVQDIMGVRYYLG